jgi:hypothetical protein
MKPGTSGGVDDGFEPSFPAKNGGEASTGCRRGSAKRTADHSCGKGGDRADAESRTTRPAVRGGVVRVEIAM